MYGIVTYIYHKHQLNVGKYTIHGSYGIDKCVEKLNFPKSQRWKHGTFLEEKKPFVLEEEYVTPSNFTWIYLGRSQRWSSWWSRRMSMWSKDPCADGEWRARTRVELDMCKSLQDGWPTAKCWQECWRRNALTKKGKHGTGMLCLWMEEQRLHKCTRQRWLLLSSKE